MHVFVINLPEAIARRKAIEKQLKELGLPYEIFPAIQGKLLSPEEKTRHYDKTWFIRNEGRPIGAGELGCCLSHIAIYRLIRERNLPHALILEDDAWLNPNLPQLLQAIEKKVAPEEDNVFLLSWTIGISTKMLQTLWAGYQIVKVRSAVCTHGYVVSKVAAAALLKALYPVRHMPDPWDWLRRHQIVNLQAVIPVCITADLSHESDIAPETTGSTKRPFMRRLAHKAYRGWWLVVDYAGALMHRIRKIGNCK